MLSRTAQHTPLARGHARDRDEAHPGHAVGHIQDFRDRPDLLDGVDFRSDIDGHNDSDCPVAIYDKRAGNDCSGNEWAGSRLASFMPE